MTLQPDLIFLALIGIAAAVGLFLQWRDRRAYRRDVDRRIGLCIRDWRGW